MKFVKRISLFFIYPVTMFSLGFAGNMMIQEFFYPGAGRTTAISEEEAQTGKETDSQADRASEFQADPADMPKEDTEAALFETPVITADTSYVVVSYQTISGESSSQEETTPAKYIGLTREKLEEELKLYGESPSLTDQEKGFEHIELVSFSPARVVVRKSYQGQEGFFLLNENHQVVVYDKSLTRIYMNTGIRTRELPAELQEEILHMKYMESEEELYHFLESYSS